MIKAVIFDIDGVLIDSFEANFKFFQNLMIKAGFPPPTRKKFTPIFHLSMWDVIKTLTNSSSEKEINKIWEMGKIRRDVLYPNDLLKISNNTEKILDSLNKKYLLGIVTSRVKEGVFSIPALAKLQKYFKAVISYQDTVNHKPHPEPLLLACRKLHVNPNEVVYIGDVENDVIAGKAAGTKVIAYSKNKLNNADAYTYSFKQLEKIVNSL